MGPAEGYDRYGPRKRVSRRLLQSNTHEEGRAPLDPGPLIPRQHGTLNPTDEGAIVLTMGLICRGQVVSYEGTGPRGSG